MDSLTNLPNLVNLETGEIKWDLIKELSGETTEEIKKLKCKKCNKIFFCKNYHGDYPLCKDDRNNTFKKSIN